MTSSVNQANISASKLKEYKILIPNIDEQNIVVTELDALREQTDALKAMYQRKMAGLDDESRWRGILEYFQPAVQLGLTPTPRRDVNKDTCLYFGQPVYTYSLKEGINDGFLTPFRLKEIVTNYDSYTYTSDDTVLEGEIEVRTRIHAGGSEPCH